MTLPDLNVEIVAGQERVHTTHGLELKQQPNHQRFGGKSEQYRYTEMYCIREMATFQPICNNFIYLLTILGT